MKYTLLPALVLAVLLNTGCVSKINDSRLNMDLGNVRQSEILKLVNSNDDITLYNMGSQIMVESGFMNQSGQEYGYYAIAIYNYVDSAPNLFILGLVNGLKRVGPERSTAKTAASARLTSFAL